MAKDKIPLAAGASARLAIKTIPEGLTASQVQSLNIAAARCSKVIVRAPPKLPPNPVLTISVSPADLPQGQNAISQPIQFFDETAFPRNAKIWIRQSSLAALEANGRLAEVMAHEIFHCLGFGFSWQSYDLTAKSVSDGLVFIGEVAVAEYKSFLAKAGKNAAVDGVPIEQEATAEQGALHWRESVLGDELMTTAQKPGRPSYLSAITIASFHDLGYGVDFSRADPYPPV